MFREPGMFKFLYFWFKQEEVVTASKKMKCLSDLSVSECIRIYKELGISADQWGINFDSYDYMITKLPERDYDE